MPIFRSNKDIFKTSSEESFESKWMDSNTIITPKKNIWDYSRELKVEEVDLWEVLYESSEGFRVYAAWEPYAEFYMVCGRAPDRSIIILETFYGAGSQNNLLKYMVINKIPFSLTKVFVDPEDMWLYQD